MTNKDVSIKEQVEKELRKKYNEQEVFIFLNSIDFKEDNMFPLNKDFEIGKEEYNFYKNHDLVKSIISTAEPCYATITLTEEANKILQSAINKPSLENFIGSKKEEPKGVLSKITSKIFRK